MATTQKTPTDKNFRTGDGNAAEQATAEFKATQAATDAQRAGTDAFGATAEANESAQAIARDAFRATADLTAEVWERNFALAARLTPAYLDSYERTVKSFSSLWEQAGQSASQIGETASSAPRAVTSSLVQAGQAVSEIPQTVGNALTGAGKAISQVPQSIGETVSSQVPQTLPNLAKAQADFLREAAEASAAAVRQGVQTRDGEGTRTAR